MLSRFDPKGDRHAEPRLLVYGRGDQFTLSEGLDYEVHGIVVYDGLVASLIVDDDSYLEWVPNYLLEIIDPRIPDSWICSIFGQQVPSLVLGPPVVAASQEDYERLVDQDSQKIADFWKWLRARRDREA